MNGNTGLALALEDRILQGDLKHQEVMVALCLKRLIIQGKEDGAVAPAAAIAETLRKDPCNVRKTLKALEAKGVISTVGGQVRFTCQNRSNLPAATGKKYLPKQVNSTCRQTRKGAPNQPSRGALYTSNTNREKVNHDGEGHVSSSSSKGFAFTPDEMAALSRVSEGLSIQPSKLTGRIRSKLKELLTKHDNPASLLEEFDALERSVKLAWYCRAMEVAKAKESEPGGWVNLAAGAIRRHLMAGTNLLDEHPKVVDLTQAQEARDTGPWAGHPWAVWFRNAGGAADWTVIRQQAERITHLGGTCDWQEAHRLFKAGGVIPAADYVWACKETWKRGRDATA